MSAISVFHGPNLNLLGSREPKLYGKDTLSAIEEMLKTEAQAMGHSIHSFQSNCEGKLIDAIHETRNQKINFILINAGALTHTSIALRDALLSVHIPFIELHLSNTYSRESFRHRSYLADIAVGIIMGFGVHSYHLALIAAHHYLQNTK